MPLLNEHRMSCNAACTAYKSEETTSSNFHLQLEHSHLIDSISKQSRIYYIEPVEHFAHVLLQQSKNIDSSEMNELLIHLKYS